MSRVGQAKIFYGNCFLLGTDKGKELKNKMKNLFPNEYKKSESSEYGYMKIGNVYIFMHYSDAEVNVKHYFVVAYKKPVEKFEYDDPKIKLPKIDEDVEKELSEICSQFGFEKVKFGWNTFVTVD